MLVERIIQFGFFAGQTIVIVIALIVLISFLFSLAQKAKQKTELEIEDLSEKYTSLGKALKNQSLSKKEVKSLIKKEKKEKKSKNKESSKDNIYFIEFDGDIKANAVDCLRTEVTAILEAANPGEEVIVSVESPGGIVHGYGLAAAQLLRLKNKGLKVTVCVDKVAASGGYMMACVADQIIAAPFAILGSIGVLAQVPNFNRLLKKHEIDYREITAGDYKRTISLFGEITPKGEEKFRSQINQTHDLFKEFVNEHRPQLDIDQVATGEYWYGKDALKLKLVDTISTSDDYLLGKSKEFKIQKITFQEKKKLAEKIGLVGAASIGKIYDKLMLKTQEAKHL